MPKTEDYHATGKKTSQSQNRSGEAGRWAEVEPGGSRPSSPFAAIRRTRFSSVPLVQIKHGEVEHITFPASVELPRRHVTFCSDVDSDSSLSGGGFCSVSDTVESFKEIGGSPYAQQSLRIKHLTKNSDGTSRFPKLDECAHFHYDNVELGPINVSLLTDRLPGDSASEWWFALQVSSEDKSWRVRRSLENFQMLDRQLHRCVYDRKFSLLKEVTTAECTEDVLRSMLTEYLERFSQLAGSLINCGPVLNWLELDNRGNRLIVTDEAAINTPAIAAAYVIKRYASQASDEISLEVGDIISVIDMPPPDESTWWRGKKGFQVGFFPCECVELIGDKVPQSIKIPKVSAKPVLRKHGKLIAFFRSFLLSRPSRRKLKQSGILKERVFGCDLGEHLMNTGRDIPLVLKYCTEFIEQHGIVDGIYRLSGVTSNIQKLRLAFDEDKVPNLLDEAILQDIHCVASLLKMYFRELPNPLLTFHLYDKFVSAVQAEEHMRLLKLRDVVQQLPPPHYRSLEYLMRHLSKVAAYGCQTGMTPKNVAIVWAPNLLRDIENGGVGALHVVGVQAVLTEYLIRYTDIIFSEKMPIFPTPVSCEETPKKTRPKSLAISTPTKLLSLEEARSRAFTSNLPGDRQKFIEVGGGEESLPVKYHTVIDLPVRHQTSGKSKKSPSGWRSFFSRGWHTASERRKNRRLRGKDGAARPKISSPMFFQHSPLNLQDKAVTESDVLHSNTKKLRTVKSAESLFPPMGVSLCQSVDEKSPFNSIDESGTSSQQTSSDLFPSQENFPSTTAKSTNCQKHMRSTSHDSYFERVVEVPTDEESEMDDPASDAILMKSSIRSDETDSDKMAQSSDPLNGSPYKRSKVAQKQKLMSFDTEASSPKLQKLSLKRGSYDSSSPPIVKKKDNQLCSSNNVTAQSMTTKELTSLIDVKKACNINNTKLIEDAPIYFSEAVYLSSTSTPVPFSDKSLNQAVDSKDITCAEIHATVTSSASGLTQQSSEENGRQTSICDESDPAMSFSMEATISESVSLSQLLSFDSKDDLNVSTDNDSKERNTNFSLIAHDGSLTTPDSPTGDNVSEMPSSAGSEVSSSTGDIDKQTSASESFDGIDMPRKGLDPVDESAQFDDEIMNDHQQLSKEQNNGTFGVEEQLAAQTKQLQITTIFAEQSPKNITDVSESTFQVIDIDNSLQLENSFVEHVISPPENFVDVGKRKDVAIGNGNIEQPSRSSVETNDICNKFVSNIAVSGSCGNDLFQSSCDFFDSLTSHNKRRSGSEKLSPISPVEESKRKFESEIGRLIVRDRQMKLEMEQMKAERQRHKPKQETPTVVENNKTRVERKFADAVDFRKSPVKSVEQNRKKLDSDDFIKNHRDSPEKSSDFLSHHGYSRYVRMDNKPSVKELLSRFEGQKQHNDIPEFSKFSDIDGPKQSANVFCNIQVINHSGLPATCKSMALDHAEGNHSLKNKQSSQNTQSTHREHIFQTECVVRFPHPKSSEEGNRTPSHKICDVNSSPIQSGIKSRGFLYDSGKSWTPQPLLDTSVHRLALNELMHPSVLRSASDTSVHPSLQRSVNLHKQVDEEPLSLDSSMLRLTSVYPSVLRSASDTSVHPRSPRSVNLHQNLDEESLLLEASVNRSTMDTSVHSSVLKSASGASVHTSLPRSGIQELHRGRSLLRQKVDSLHSNGDQSHQSLSGGEGSKSPFSTFKDSFERANKLTLQQRRKEFLRELETPVAEPPHNARFPHFGTSTNEKHRRQRPKSVPPSTGRLSLASTKLSSGKTVSSEVPKAGGCHSNGGWSLESSQHPPKHIRERAAIFERSLSFNSYMEKKHS